MSVSFSLILALALVMTTSGGDYSWRGSGVTTPGGVAIAGVTTPGGVAIAGVTTPGGVTIAGGDYFIEYPGEERRGEPI